MIREMADSASSVGARPLASISIRSSESFQLSFEAICTPCSLYISRTGSSRRPGRGAPLAVIDGPIARRIIRFGSRPVTMNPPKRTLSLVCTRKRDEMFSNLAGVAEVPGVGEAVGVAVGVAVGAAVAVGLGAMVAVGEAVAAGEGVGVIPGL